ncbi:MAG: helix-hairpin-helix domain-containing protein, partial [Aureispira sp.]|nr:helix-hairpin-helix domain-containing protein [Aureispira sp.]
MKWIDGLKNYLYYTRQERNGIVVLLVLAILLFALPLLYPFLVSQETINAQEFQLATDAFRASLSNLPSKQTAYNNSYKKNSFKFRGEEQEGSTLPAEEFPFNPNTASKEDFVTLGLSGKTAKSILNYRSKGGQFRKVEDFKKIYTLSDTDYQRLRPYIQLPSKEDVLAANNTTIQEASTVAIETFSFDPNTATKEEFLRLGLSAK